MLYEQIIPLLFKVSVTTAAMCIPTTSVAYVILGIVPGERRRMSLVIGYGTIAALFLILSSMISFLVLGLGYESYLSSLILCGGLYLSGFILLLYVLLLLSGFRRVVPLPPE